MESETALSLESPDGLRIPGRPTLTRLQRLIQVVSCLLALSFLVRGARANPTIAGNFGGGPSCFTCHTDPTTAKFNAFGAAICGSAQKPCAGTSCLSALKSGMSWLSDGCGALRAADTDGDGTANAQELSEGRQPAVPDACQSATCPANARCQENGGASCTCYSGFEPVVSGSTFRCDDINECLTDNGGCGAHSTCTNTPGTRTCKCDPTFVSIGSGCACPSGFAVDASGKCGDIHECATNNGNCAANSTCVEAEGGYSCPCNAGYFGDGKQPVGCTRSDVCVAPSGSPTCSPLVSCALQYDTATCGACPAGYKDPSQKPDGRACADVDECATDNGGCDPATVCTNAPGTFSCSACPSGTIGDGISGCKPKACDVGCAPFAVCAGSGCACRSGFTGNGQTCADVDECQSDSCGGSACSNLPGTHICTCPNAAALARPLGVADLRRPPPRSPNLFALFGLVGLLPLLLLSRRRPRQALVALASMALFGAMGLEACGGDSGASTPAAADAGVGAASGADSGGSAGNVGTSGSSGSLGTAGSAGSSGNLGTSGSSGDAGGSGVGGSAGGAGAAGSAGTSGGAGSAGGSGSAGAGTSGSGGGGCTLSCQCAGDSWCNPATAACEPRYPTSPVGFDDVRAVLQRAGCNACHFATGSGDVDPRGTGTSLVLAGGRAAAYASLVNEGVGCANGPRRVCVDEPALSLLAALTVDTAETHGKPSVTFGSWADPDLQTILRWIASGAPRAALAGFCGDGVVQAGEECDDAGLTQAGCSYGQKTCTICTSDCKLSQTSGHYCGDGSIDAPYEACDDGGSTAQEVDSHGGKVCGATCAWMAGKPCGADGLACCTEPGRSACGMDEACVGGKCTAACGVPGKPCCDHTVAKGHTDGCRDFSYCASGACTPCGALGSPCCPSTAYKLAVTDSQCDRRNSECDYTTTPAGAQYGMCTECGGGGELCCGSATYHDICNSGMTCTLQSSGPNRCASCGGEGQPCCCPGGGGCLDAALTCNTGQACVRHDGSVRTSFKCFGTCGSLNQPCCSGTDCATGFKCSGGACVAQ